MKYSTNNQPIVCMQTQSTCYKGTTVGKPVGILWHDTGACNPYIKRYVQPSDNDANKASLLALLGKNAYGNDWNHISQQAGLNAWVGKLADGTVATVQSMPWNYRPWGCGSGSKGSCNGSSGVSNSPFWIQFEICDDGYGDASYFAKAYKEACELTAYLCKLYNINPNGSVSYNGVTVPTILCHQDSYRLGLGSNHGDVYLWFNKYDKTMANVRSDVAALLGSSGNGSYSGSGTGSGGGTSTTSFKAGDVVEITGSTYYNGKSVPAWVKAKAWIVYSASGDRVVINKSEDGANAIMSPFKASDLALKNAPQTPAGVSSHSVLSKGSTGDEVKELQQKLTALGYSLGSIDGDFGDKTLAAVKKFQEDYSLDVDGVVGNQTWSALDKAVASKSAVPYVVRVTTDALNIRKGAGTNYAVVGCIRDKGAYTIVEEKAGTGASKWGLLKAYASGKNGWISLDYVKKV